ncbi:methyl-accepting chemotaxis protein [Desulfobacterales bacterium HSG2]|nr:methyl-accepting chemotaxis protein [Desulfobacterales bacterium HSG2]
MKIKSRIAVWTGACVLVTALIIISYSVCSMRGNMLDAAMEEAVILARGQAAAMESEMKEALDAARILAQTLSAVKEKDVQLDIDRDNVTDILRIILEKNPRFAGVHTCWEPEGFDAMDEGYAGERGHDETGRFAPWWQRDADGKSEIRSMLVCPIHSPGGMPGKWYDIPGKTMKECVLDPFEHPVRGEEMLIVTLTAPVIANERFHGVVGIDLRLDFLQTMADNLDIYDKSGKMMVISNNGILAGITGRPDLVGGHIKTVRKEHEDVLAVIRKGRETRDVMEGNLEIFTPLKIGNTNTPWSVCILVPEEKVTAIASKLMLKMIVIGIICVLVALTVLWFIAAGIAGPISKVVEIADAIADGDFSQRLNMTGRDEIGSMARALDNSCKKLSEMLNGIRDSADMLAASSGELSAVSGQMSSSAGEMESQSDTVASASEQVAASVGLVASSAEQSGSSISNIASMSEEMSSSFSNVADFARKTADNTASMARSGEDISARISGIAVSSGEMTSSLNEVAKITARANRISQNAGRQAEQINARMDALVSASKKIGKVVGVIREIADQTNMLALNATIEAAGAGEAGRGFAVVAGEVKELAKQSAEATDEIAGQIEEIQTSTDGVVQAVGEINKVMGEIAGISETIAASVEEQTSMASEISKSVSDTAVTVKNVAGNAKESADLVKNIAVSTEDASKTAAEITQNIDDLRKGVNGVTRSSDEAARGVMRIAENIQGVNTASKQNAEGASAIDESSKKLAEMASELARIVSRFKLDV